LYAGRAHDSRGIGKVGRDEYLFCGYADRPQYRVCNMATWYHIVDDEE
jgi:hypothetical protein